MARQENEEDFIETGGTDSTTDAANAAAAAAKAAADKAAADAKAAADKAAADAAAAKAASDAATTKAASDASNTTTTTTSTTNANPNVAVVDYVKANPTATSGDIAAKITELGADIDTVADLSGVDRDIARNTFNVANAANASRAATNRLITNYNNDYGADQGEDGEDPGDVFIDLPGVGGY